MKRVLGSDSPKNQFEASAQFESAEQKAERNRERNREHAKKTRLRKKEMIEGMKIRLLELQRESARLEQLVEESNTASILLCLGGKQEVAAPSSSASPVSSIANSPISFGRSNEESTALSSNKRRRMGSDGEETSTVTEGERKESEPGLGLSVSLMKGNIIDQLRQKVRVEAAKNFNKGDYGFCSSSSASSLIMDEGDEDDDSSVEANHKPNSSSTSSHSTDDVDNEVQNRRARNRMHAKLTRDRKKLLTNKMQETILFLESRNEQLKSQLDQMMKSSVNVSAQHQSPPQHQNLSQSQPNAAVAFAMPTLYGNIPFEQKMPKGYDPLTAFCYFAEVWNQAMEGRAHPSSSKPKTIPTF